MRAIKKLSRSLASALFTVALGDTFDWVQSAPAGTRPRYSPPPPTQINDSSPVTSAWKQQDDFGPTAG